MNGDQLLSMSEHEGCISVGGYFYGPQAPFVQAIGRMDAMRQRQHDDEQEIDALYRDLGGEG